MTREEEVEKARQDWREEWKGMGVSQVAVSIADGAWGTHKRGQARLWLREELARIEEEERTARRRAAVTFWLSIAAVFISVGALIRGG